MESHNESQSALSPLHFLQHIGLEVAKRYARGVADLVDHTDSFFMRAVLSG